jgi:hypothetical protein
MIAAATGAGALWKQMGNHTPERVQSTHRTINSHLLDLSFGVSCKLQSTNALERLGSEPAGSTRREEPRTTQLREDEHTIVACSLVAVQKVMIAVGSAHRCSSQCS